MNGTSTMKRVAAWPLLAMLLCLGCATAERQRQDVAEELSVIFKDCGTKFQSTGYAAVARCAQQPTQAVYEKRTFPYMDLVDLFLAQWVAISTKVDEGQLRPEDAQMQLMEQLFRITGEAQRRDGQFERRWLLLSELRPSLPARR